MARWVVDFLTWASKIGCVAVEPRLGLVLLRFGLSFWLKSSARLVSFSKKLGLEKSAKTSLFQTKETYGLQNLFNAQSFYF